MHADDPIAVLGADGMLGRAVLAECARLSLPAHPLTRSQVDLRDDASIARLGERRWGAIVNCAAWTDVDGAETREADATRINGAAVARLAEAAARARATLIHFSTDYVFDGAATTPYPTNHPRSPVNAYGRSKAAGEAALETSDADWLCVRTSWLYAPWGKNFVLTMARLLAERPSVSVVDDQRGRPTSASHLARRALALARAGTRGVQHATDAGECTWHGFAAEIAALTGSAANVIPCTSDQFQRLARRPAYSVLDISQTDAAIGPAAGWREELARVLREAGLLAVKETV